MEAPYTSQQFNRTQIDKISDTIHQLSDLLTWVDVDQEGLINFWQSSVAKDITPFKNELRDGTTWATNSGQLAGYQSFVWKSTKPVEIMSVQVKQWLKDNPDKSNAMAIVFSQYIKINGQATPTYTPDHKHEIRQTLVQIEHYLDALLQAVVEIWQPLLSSAKISKRNPEQIDEASKNDDRPNVFNPRLPLVEVRKWFIQLAENDSSADVPFLTTDEVDQFIERAFVGKDGLPKLTLKAGRRSKGQAIGLFHKFYFYCTTHQPKMGKIDSTGTADKYIKLITDHFDNWTFDEVVHNFRSGGNWQKPA